MEYASTALKPSLRSACMAATSMVIPPIASSGT